MYTFSCVRILCSFTSVAFISLSFRDKMFLNELSDKERNNTLSQIEFKAPLTARFRLPIDVVIRHLKEVTFTHLHFVLCKPQYEILHTCWVHDVVLSKSVLTYMIPLASYPHVELCTFVSSDMINVCHVVNKHGTSVRCWYNSSLRTSHQQKFSYEHS